MVQKRLLQDKEFVFSTLVPRRASCLRITEPIGIIAYKQHPPRERGDFESWSSLASAICETLKSDSADVICFGDFDC